MSDAEFKAPGEEYASKTIVINHLANATRDDGHVVLSQVFSTETAVEALVAQLRYFGMTELIGKGRVVQLLASATEKAAILVLEVPPHGNHMGQTQIIVDAMLWQDPELVAQFNPEGTVLSFDAAIIALAKDLQRVTREQSPGDYISAWISN